MKACALAAALSVAGILTAAAQTTGTSAPTTGPSREEAAKATFCSDAEALYKEVLATNPPPGEKGLPSTPITYSVYRSGATTRIITLVSAARCNLSPFLGIERDYLIRAVRSGKGYQPYGPTTSQQTGTPSR